MPVESHSTPLAAMAGSKGKEYDGYCCNYRLLITDY